MNDESPAVGEVDEALLHPWLDRYPTSLGEAMRLIGRYTESEGGNSPETRQARANLLDAYEGWCRADRPEQVAAAVSDPDADTTVRYEVLCTGGHEHDFYAVRDANPDAAKARWLAVGCNGPWSVVKVTTATTREVLS